MNAVGTGSVVEIRSPAVSPSEETAGRAISTEVRW